MAEIHHAAAHVLRRTTFGPFTGAIGDAASRPGGVRQLIDEIVAAPPVPFEPWAVVDGAREDLDIDVADSPRPEGTEEERRRIARVMAFRPWWVRRMASDEAGLHEKLMWFWHGHFTTSSDKVDDTTLCWRQLRTLHRHATGNFGDLAKAMTVDGAMLKYLDGASSVADEPNENYAREFLELFTLGLGRFDQSDVVAAAKVFAGYTVTNPDQEVVRVDENTLHRPVRAFGVRGRFSPDDLIDVVLRQDACAPFVVTKLWRSFIGGEPDRPTIDRWAKGFRSSGYEILPLVERMLHSDVFAERVFSRARSPIEWYCAATRATGDAERDTNWDLFQLGQSPYRPPSVAGWPDVWLSPTQSHARALLLGELSFPEADALTELPLDRLLPAIADRCGVPGWSDASAAALGDLHTRSAAGGVEDRVRVAALLAAALMPPELSLA